MTEHTNTDKITADLVDELLRWWGTLLPLVEHGMRTFDGRYDEERGFPINLLEKVTSPLASVVEEDPDAAVTATRMLTAAGIALAKDMVVVPFPVLGGPPRAARRAARRRRA